MGARLELCPKGLSSTISCGLPGLKWHSTPNLTYFAKSSFSKRSISGQDQRHIVGTVSRPHGRKIQELKDGQCHGGSFRKNDALELVSSLPEIQLEGKFNNQARNEVLWRTLIGDKMIKAPELEHKGL
jgi:hypothetical protein